MTGNGGRTPAIFARVRDHLGAIGKQGLHANYAEIAAQANV